MKRVTEPKKISEANFYAETRKVDLSSESNTVDFDLGFEARYCLVGAAISFCVMAAQTMMLKRWEAPSARIRIPLPPEKVSRSQPH